MHSQNVSFIIPSGLSFKRISIYYNLCILCCKTYVDKGVLNIKRNKNIKLSPHVTTSCAPTQLRYFGVYSKSVKSAEKLNWQEQ